MNLPDGITAEQWGEVCERMGWWKRGLRCGPSHNSGCTHKERNYGDHDIPCPPITDELLMQVLRAGIRHNEDLLMRIDYEIQPDPMARQIGLDAAIIRAYLALPKG